MTSSTLRIITTALATLALAAPAATAMPLYEHDGSSAPARGQDLRNPDQQAPAPALPKQDLRNPDQQAPGVERVPAQQPTTIAPVERTKPAPVVTHDDGPSPLVFILPSLVLIAMLGAATVYVKSARPVRRSVA